jgi:hypothetical protein
MIARPHFVRKSLPSKEVGTSGQQKKLRSKFCPEFGHWSLPAVPEIIDPVFAKTSPKRWFSMTENERFGLVFTKTRVYKFGHRCGPVGSSVPEIIDPVFAKTSQNARFLLSENERFGLVFVKTGSINSGAVEECGKIDNDAPESIPKQKFNFWLVEKTWLWPKQVEWRGGGMFSRGERGWRRWCGQPLPAYSFS